MNALKALTEFFFVLIFTIMLRFSVCLLRENLT